MISPEVARRPPPAPPPATPPTLPATSSGRPPAGGWRSRVRLPPCTSDSDSEHPSPSESMFQTKTSSPRAGISPPPESRFPAGLYGLAEFTAVTSTAATAAGVAPNAVANAISRNGRHRRHRRHPLRQLRKLSRGSPLRVSPSELPCSEPIMWQRSAAAPPRPSPGTSTTPRT